jgi:hypothetical protein
MEHPYSVDIPRLYTRAYQFHRNDAIRTIEPLHGRIASRRCSNRAILSQHRMGVAMKASIGKYVVVALIALTIGLRAGHAQISNQLDFKMSQPFTVANTTLEPGSYVIRPVEGAGQSVVEIASTSGRPAVMVDVDSATPNSAQGGSQLVFNKYKNVLALSQVFPGNGNTGYQLVQGHPEQMAAKTEQPTKQTVATTAK